MEGPIVIFQIYTHVLSFFIFFHSLHSANRDALESSSISPAASVSLQTCGRPMLVF